MNQQYPRAVARTIYASSVLAAVSSVVVGCQFAGLNSLNAPGTSGHGKGSFEITVELPDVSTLPQNSPVLVDDVTVGSVSGVEAVQRVDGSFYAAVKLSLEPSVDLPANSTVRVAQTSLLGSKHIELAAPEGQAPFGRLQAGSTLDLAQADSYPTTEEVLSSLGIVVNKGNLGALQDITNEMFDAVAGRKGQFANLIPRLAEFTASVDRQTAQLISATEALNRVAGTLATGTDKIERALDTLPAALETLNNNSAQTIAAFAALQRFSDVASRLLTKTKGDLAADIRDLYPVLKGLADNAKEVVDSLPYLPTYPLPGRYLDQAIRGDYLNSFVTFDLTLRRLGETLLTTSPFDQNMKHMGEIINPPDFLMGQLANLSGQAADPFKVPPREAG